MGFGAKIKKLRNRTFEDIGVGMVTGRNKASNAAGVDDPHVAGSKATNANTYGKDAFESREAQDGFGYAGSMSPIDTMAESRAKRDQRESEIKMANREVAEARRVRNAQAVRIRRAGRGDRPTTHGGTLVTGALGLPGTATPERGTRLGL